MNPTFLHEKFCHRPAIGIILLGLLLNASALLMAEDNQVVLIDGISAAFGFPYLVGETGTNNFLIITNGGRVTSGTYVGHSETANQNGIIVTGGNSYLEGSLWLGEYGSRNLLIITNGGRVHFSEGILGVKSESNNNLALVVGSGSEWTVDAPMLIGWGGSSNRIVLRDGATINGQGWMAINALNYNNAVEISGAGTIWNGGFHVGFGGSFNRLKVFDGGKVNGSVSVGMSDSSSNNVVSVSGLDTELDLDFLKVGEAGSANIMGISDGAKVSSRTGYLGGPNTIAAGHFNTVEITGSNSVWSIKEDLYVSYSGSNNTLRVKDGGTLNANAVTIAGFSNNLVHVVRGGLMTITNAVFIQNGALFVDGGDATVGQLWCNNATGGELLLHAGSLVVTQKSGIDYGTNSLIIGGATGQTVMLTFLPGEQSLRAGEILIGTAPDSRGELHISGPKSFVTAPVFVGENDRTRGKGRLLLDEGATLEADRIVSGTNGSGLVFNDGGVFQFTTAQPTVTSLSPESIVLTNGTISFRNVANADPRIFGRANTDLVLKGDTAFRLSNSTNVVLDGFAFGRSNTNDFFRLELIGGTTVWNGTNLTFGPRGEMQISNTVATVGGSQGTLEVKDGSKVKNFVDANNFNRSVSNLTVALVGPGTVWTNVTAFSVGYEGANNNFSIVAGAILHDREGYIGYWTSSSNNWVRVSGVGSMWNNAIGVTVGSSGSRNRLYIEDGAEIRTGRLSIGVSSGTNEVWVSRGKLLVTNFAGSGSIVVRGGVLNVNDGFVATDFLSLSQSSSAKVNFFSGLMECGSATVTTGVPFVVGDGTNSAILSLRTPLVHNFSKGLIVSSNGWLLTYGTITGDVTNRGGIAMRTSPGSSRINGSLRLQGNPEMIFKVGGLNAGVEYDFLNVTNMVDLEGSMRVYLTNNFRPAWTNSFDVLRYRSRNGEFTNAKNGKRVGVVNSAGSFRVAYTSGSLNLSDFRLDENGDGIDETWAVSYFGVDFLPVGFGPNDRYGDKDGDGLNNYQEYVAGTDPLNPSNAFQITAIGLNGSGHAVLEFQCVSNRTYGIEFSADMSTWKTVVSPAFSNPMVGTCRWTDDGTQTGGLPALNLKRFYRVTVE